MPEPSQVHLHIRRLLVDRAAVGEEGVFDAQALREQIALQLGWPATKPVVHGLASRPLINIIATKLVQQVSPHLASPTAAPTAPK